MANSDTTGGASVNAEASEPRHRAALIGVDVTIDEETLDGAIVDIRRALRVGLASYGEIDRILNSANILFCEDEGMKPARPSEDPAALSFFSGAMHWLEILEDSRRSALEKARQAARDAAASSL